MNRYVGGNRRSNAQTVYGAAILKFEKPNTRFHIFKKINPLFLLKVFKNPMP
ncbi:hypothetical protein [Methanolapillus ohkumae]|uniref:hypothetical protein n=1 Tax=Methanolapillus ohkumae TaxID=3028298 RepID=UPI0030B8DBA5